MKAKAKVKVKVKVQGTGHSRDSSRRETGLSSGVLQPQKKEACRVCVCVCV